MHQAQLVLYTRTGDWQVLVLRMDGVFAIVPVGSVSRTFCRDLGQALTEALGRGYEVLPSLADPQYAFNPARQQYHSTAVVRRVSHAIDPKKHVLGVGLVDVDLFTPDLNFVFGEADRAEKAAVVSLARMKPSFYGRPEDTSVTLRRVTSEALHEVGHIFGLPHCPTDSCAMFFANTLSDTDRKRPRFCDNCRDRLGLEPRR